MKLLRTIIPAVSVAMLLNACSDDKQPDLDPIPAEDPVSRTILVYMAANNSLGSPNNSYRNQADIQEMITAASTQGFNGGRVIVYHHAYKAAHPVLLEITPDGAIGLKYYDTATSSVDAARMTEVISDTRKVAPADEYGLILWSHGSGWLEDGMESKTTAYSFGEDREWLSDINYRKSTMNVTTLADIIGNDRPFAFIYFDCCYMSGIEVAYELRNATDYIIASATELPADGMRYDLNLPLLFKTQPDIVGAAKTTFEQYDVLSGGERTCTMSVIKCDALDGLAEYTRDIYSSVTPVKSVQGIQTFKTTTPYYYYDMEQYIEALSPAPDLLENWEKALADVVVYKANTPSLWGYWPVTRHCGLSTYPLTSPNSATTKGYDRFEWYADVASSLIADRQ